MLCTHKPSEPQSLRVQFLTIVFFINTQYVVQWLSNTKQFSKGKHPYIRILRGHTRNVIVRKCDVLSVVS